MLTFFFLLAGAHYCGDLLSYSPTASGNKRTDQTGVRLTTLAVHCLIHVLWIWLWLWPWNIFTKIQVSVFLFVIHFIIDFIRPHIETTLIPKDKFIIFEQKKDVLLWFTGKANKQVTDFLDAYFFRWLFINILDQGLHLASLAACALLFYKG